MSEFWVVLKWFKYCYSEHVEQHSDIKDIIKNLKEQAIKTPHNANNVGVTLPKLLQHHTLCLWGPRLWPFVSLFCPGRGDCARKSVLLLVGPKSLQ